LLVVAVLAGYFLPSYWVERKSEYRQLETQLGFPDVLDLLLVCVEAGNSVDQALARVTRQIKTTNPTLFDELSVTSDELRAGKERAVAFRDFAARVKVDDVSAFATVLRQSDEYGVSIADTLRVYSSEMRYKRIMRAEEKANIMPLKLAMGTMAFTVPPIMLIMAGPSVIAILTAFAGMGR
jgi:tight adherence protein C